MTKTKRYPKQGVITPKKGLRLSGNMLEVEKEYALKLQNMYYVNKSILQRKAFSQYSTEDFSAEASGGRTFRGTHEYINQSGTSRKLWLTNSGKIQEWLTDSTHADRVTGLSSDNEGSFENFFNSVAFANGSDSPRVGKDTTWQELGSPPSLSSFSVSPSGSGSFTGTYLHIVIPVIEVSGVGVIFGDWPTIQSTTASSDAQFDVTWTDVVDTRVTHYYYYRTKAGSTIFESVAKIASGVESYTDTTVDADLPNVVSGVPRYPSAQSSWGPSPVSQDIVFCGNRLVYLGLNNEENAFQLGRIGADEYEVQGVPADGSTKIFCPGKGPIKAGFAIGETGEGSPRANHLFIAQEKSCYYLPETDEKQRLQIISSQVGCINKQAIAQYSNYLFFQSRRGVEFWPGPGNDIFLISDDIKPIFAGGGINNDTANQSDEDIKYEVWEDTLLITIRDDASKTGANKIYSLDLQYFKRAFDPIVPSRGARFAGPWANGTLGMDYALGLESGELLIFDSENSRILQWDKNEGQDSINSVNTDMEAVIWMAPQLVDSPLDQYWITNLYLIAFTATAIEYVLDAEYSRIKLPGSFGPNTIDFVWDDIVWDDIEWTEETWNQEEALPWGDFVVSWFVPKFSKTDSQTDFAFHGLAMELQAWKKDFTFR